MYASLYSINNHVFLGRVKLIRVVLLRNLASMLSESCCLSSLCLYELAFQGDKPVCYKTKEGGCVHMVCFLFAHAP